MQETGSRPSELHMLGTYYGDARSFLFQLVKRLQKDKQQAELRVSASKVRPNPRFQEEQIIHVIIILSSS